MTDDYPRILLDQSKPLSECSIWDMLHDLYATAPANLLWEAVPSHITSNPSIAGHYANLIVSFLMDCRSALNSAKPIYIIELGCGSGCFSYYLLKELERKSEYFPEMRDLPLRYVMTDFTDSNLNYCRDHGNFAQYREQGRLSFARFEPDQQLEITTYGGTRINQDTVENPIILVANYVFDSLRHDAFRIENGKLKEVRHSFYRKQDGKPVNFDQIEKTEDYVDIVSDYYEDKVFNSILDFYCRRFRNASILFPLGALTCLRNFKYLSHGNLLLLSSDRGYTDETAMEGLWQQQFDSELTFFSYQVNYHAIRKYFEHFGGKTFATSGHTPLIHTQFSCLLADKTIPLELSQFAFNELVARSNPINNVYNCYEFLADLPRTTVAEKAKAYMGIVSLSNYDPVVFCACAEKLSQLVADMHVHLRQDLAAMLDLVEDNFFKVRKGHNSLYWIGRLRYALGDSPGAIAALNRSCREFEETGNALYYLGLCHETLGEHAAALRCMERSLELAPDSTVIAEAVGRLKQCKS